MEWSWTAFSLTFVFVVLEGAASFFEGTLTSGGYRHSPLPFLNHAGASWGDGLILSVLNAILIPHLKTSLPSIGLALLLGTLITVSIHYWWGTMPGKCCIFPHKGEAHGLGALGLLGWLHVIYMSATLAILTLYIFTPLPYEVRKSVILAVSALLVLHIPLGTLQPTWYAHGKLAAQDVYTCVGLIFLVGLAAKLKS